MKKLKSLVWTDIIPKTKKVDLSKYSTVEEIVKETGYSDTTIRQRLNKAGVEKIKAHAPNGNVVYYYRKDKQ